MWLDRRMLLAGCVCLGAQLFGNHFAVRLGSMLLVKELSNMVDSHWKCCLGPGVGLLWWYLDESVGVVLLGAGLLYVVYLYYQGFEPEPMILGAKIESILSETGTRPVAGVIWLHGLGDSARGCSSIARVLSLDVATVWLCPSAPVRQLSADWGLPRRAWFDVFTAPVSVSGKEDTKGLAQSVRLVNKAVKRLEAFGIEPHQIVVGGLSQGGAAALTAAMTLPKGLGGVACIAGWLPRSVTLRPGTSKMNKPPPHRRPPPKKND
eukprot:3143297-Amphidinium_carterae.2